MKKINRKTEEVDLFLKLKNDFCYIISNGLFTITEIDKVSFKVEYNFDENHIKREIHKAFLNIKSNAIATLAALSMPEIFFYIFKSLNDYEVHRDENSDRFFNYFLKKYAILDDSFNKLELLNDRFRNYYNENNEFKDQFDSHIESYIKIYFGTYEKLYEYFLELNKHYTEGHLTKESKSEVFQYIINNHRPVFILNKELELSRLNLNGKMELSEFKIKQIIILIELLKENRIILNYDLMSLVEILNILTGYSKNSLSSEIRSSEEILAGIKSSRKNNRLKHKGINYTSDIMKVLEGIDKLKSTLKAKLEIVKNKIN